ncbi:hypothetical protein SAMN05421509_10310 [Chromohalobacter canadensis]|uniref:Trypsin-like peptidase domain-containing protein n=1 Tax=Chromohalobacter canadensis TaxID=141389 RepID=A0A285VMV8_9GAMM|nr:hypothetical protein [Chromohalobacter canadensis]SOC53911.1 hypothetical protein SAMN05421509_10310 [Chromohalobacter canadensis]
MTEISKETFDEHISKAQSSTLAKSSRRLFFTHCNFPIEELGYWHADYIYSRGGSSTLIRFKNRFFLLTAKHVLKNNGLLDDNESTNFQNESPLLAVAKADEGWEALTSFLFPAKIWYIGELIGNQDFSISTKDIILIELHLPSPKYLPDSFINLDNPEIKRNIIVPDYFSGQTLISSGYPKKNNEFYYEETEGFTHKTYLNRQILSGICEIENGEPYISLEHTEGGNYDHDDINGMSGGIVFNTQPEMAQTNWCGLILTAGKNKIRFCPSRLILPAIERYDQAPKTIVDPSIHLAPLCDTKQATEKLGTLLEMMYK